MAKTERYETVIRLNTDQAKQEIDALQKKYEDLRKKQAGLAPDSTKYKSLQKEIDKITSKLEMTKNRVESVNDALQGMSDAKPKQLRDTIRDINALLNSGDIERGSREWKELTAALKEANTQLNHIKQETKASQPIFQGFFKFLNDSWGGLMILFQSVTGITQTIRKSVEDFAQMEEEMADVRKYTGLADAAVRDLNEDLKRMDTRTSREQLNRLAGSAGRLGKDAKKDIMEFVEAGDMINISLGDDLGDGAIEKVGKLAMAFGEDKKKGLKGAMLSTGSAINELVQNSSAMGGFLVDFTARVAGFGKQIGLTQAQIMGFGTVMDENLLRDEMAATAFGNMLTKMQTDTEKFARIAGMDVKAFTKLLNEDANAAVLALADSLKKADPQTMMKMLDDMGLDGSRAVAVLATLADKIDDVRKHQERANKAYQEGTSVIKEYEIKNNTAQAKIDKCKKKFHEMTVELGERLVPVVEHTITGASVLARMLSVLTEFIVKHGRAVVILTGYITAMTIAMNINTIAGKASNAVGTVTNALMKARMALMNNLRQAYVAWRIVIATVTANHVRLNSAMVDMKRLQMTNIWGALATVILTVGVAIYGAVKAWKSHSEAVRNSLQQVKEMRAQQELAGDLNKSVNESIAEQKTKVEQLTRVIHSNAYSVDERRNAIKTLQSIVPEYHASISKEGQLYNDNSAAIKQYIQDLKDAALAEAIYQKKVEINKKKLELNFKQNRIEGSLKAVQAYRDANPELFESRKSGAYVGASAIGDGQEMNQNLIDSKRQQKIHEERLENVKSETKTVEAEDRYLDTVLQKNRKVNELYTKKVTGSNTPVTPTSTSPTQYESESDRKKREAEAKKAAAEKLEQMREADKEAKAIMDNRLAENLLNYQAGLQDYRQFMVNQEKIQREGLQARRDAWDEDTAEYAKYQKQLAALQLNGDQERTRQSAAAIDRDHKIMREWLKSRFDDQNSEYYHNEVALNEALYEQDIEFLQEKAKLYRKGSLERMQIEWEIQDREDLHQLEQQRTFQQMVDDLKTTYLQQGNAKREQMELNALEELNKKKLLTEEEYQRAKLAIQAQYSQAQTPDEKTAAAGADMLKVAQTSAAKDAGTGTSTPIYGTISMYVATMDKLKELYEQDEKNHEAYLAAKQQATAQFCQQLASEFQTAYQTIGNLMSAASSYYGAQSDYEVAMTKKKYEKQIEAAGNNQKKVKKLQEKQAKEEAAIKTKYNNRQMKIQIAQALAQTATNALNAYGSAAAIPVVGYILAPIAAAMAVAAGMLQVATIKKQAEAQQAGYYEGGFTGGKRYRKEAGVVHEGEFVANHQAVNNPNVLPFLNFLDQAQRNNTVGSLTAQDVSRSMGAAGTTQMITPIVNVNTDNEELRDAVDGQREATQLLVQRLDEGIQAFAVIDGPNGLYQALKRFERLISKK